jgi:hypothetical protein
MQEVQKNSKKETRAFAEIIESSLQGWVAQTWQWDNFPPFGSLVSVEQGSRTYVGLVHQVKTGSIDPVRAPFAYQKTEQELLREQPQIFEFLKTTFSCLSLGYLEKEGTAQGGKLFYTLAPEPTKIHAFVTPASAQLSTQFYSSPDYLHLLFGFAHQVENIDELLLALLKNKAELQLLTAAHLERFMATYALLTGNDYRRIKLFLQRVQRLG